MAQSVKHLTLDFSSGLQGCGIEARVGLCTDSEEPAWDSLSALPCLCMFSPPPPLKIKNFKKNGDFFSEGCPFTLPRFVKVIVI